MNEDDIVSRVKRRLSEREPRRGPSELRPAAVLVPLVLRDGEHHLLFTRRADTLRRQPGDIAFPGGAIDPGDPTPLAAALRESHEEIGLHARDVALLGQLDERGTVTGFRITPFVGAIEGPYPFRTNHEVDALFEVPLRALRRPETLVVEERRFRGRKRKVYHYLYGEHDIWGITGQLVKDFLSLL